MASVGLLVIVDVIKLLLPVRRVLEGRLWGDGFRDEVGHEIRTNHPRLVELLGGDSTRGRLTQSSRDAAYPARIYFPHALWDRPPSLWLQPGAACSRRMWE